MTRKKYFLILTACLASGFMIPMQALGAADSARLPSGDFPQCSTTVVTYCISEVTFIVGGVSKSGSWVPNGSATRQTDGSAVANTFTTFGSAATNYTGRWSYDGFYTSGKLFDGLYVKVAPANEFTDTMRMSMEPAGPSSTGQVGRIKDVATNAVASLPSDIGVKVVVRLGQLNPGVTIFAGQDASVSSVLDGTVQVMTLQAYPTAIAQASSSTQCNDKVSVAVAKPNQLYAIVAFKNGRDPFGVDGLSGNLLISSNGTCKLSTPTWNSATNSMEFTASAPHFAPDGVTTNTGFYRATIPAADAKILFGISSLDVVKESTPTTTTVAPTVQSAGVTRSALLSASKVLDVQVIESSDGTQATSSQNISFDGAQFVISVTGFGYSTKNIKATTSAYYAALLQNAQVGGGSIVNTPTEGTTTATVSAPTVTTRKSATAKSIAVHAKLAVLSTSKMSLKVVPSSAKYCKVSGTTLKGLKTGSCKVTVTVTPKKGKAVSKTVTLKVSK
jgi:hypothetical protein